MAVSHVISNNIYYTDIIGFFDHCVLGAVDTLHVDTYMYMCILWHEAGWVKRCCVSPPIPSYMIYKVISLLSDT